MKIKLSRYGEITLSLTDICKSCPGHEFLNVANKSLSAIRESKTLVKNSGFTVILVQFIFNLVPGLL